MPRPGVHLLCGSNGSGKTTLLACLRRLGQPNAFATHFPAAAHVSNVDDFTAAKIVYRVDDRSVSYSYAGERWVPTPRAESELIAAFGYPDVLYSGATAERLTPRSEEIKNHRIRLAKASIIEAANEIFETSRFSNLCSINLTRGKGNPAFLLALPPNRRRFTSERNFSLGELCVLKLLRALDQSRNGSLVLIDELELALHPRAQIGLFRHLERIARDKALTVIVSTHSVTLLKFVSRHQILFLEKRENQTAVIEGCFPAYAIGEIATSEERSPDLVVYVEDEAAFSVVESLTTLVAAAKFTDESGVYCSVQVTPVGDFRNVVRHYDRSRSMFPSYVRQWILLDADVQDESIAIMANSSNDVMREVFHRHSSRIRYLPWTPEVGLVRYLASNRVSAERELRRRLHNGNLHIPPNVVNLPDVNGAHLRTSAKNAVSALVNSLHHEATNVSANAISENLYSLLAEYYFRTQREAAMQLIAPLLA